ncbi:uncharacterized protein LOC126315234 [Schistocerca gregaria]|uniref:uncharacterized protein LOC126315234 n=1 Tax=Schistocerca gregaria TaxID=7010 RepID=UPI00211EB28D|nr:uncharacterized protein LOC126315234 [Schistocerca gregaria]XP_049848431.1 uncharacterized protein LOC126315234 [Schistocerca gregaria]
MDGDTMGYIPKRPKMRNSNSNYAQMPSQENQLTYSDVNRKKSMEWRNEYISKLGPDLDKVELAGQNETLELEARFGKEDTSKGFLEFISGIQETEYEFLLKVLGDKVFSDFFSSDGPTIESDYIYVDEEDKLKSKRITLDENNTIIRSWYKHSKDRHMLKPITSSVDYSVRLNVAVEHNNEDLPTEIPEGWSTIRKKKRHSWTFLNVHKWRIDLTAVASRTQGDLTEPDATGEDKFTEFELEVENLYLSQVCSQRNSFEGYNDSDSKQDEKLKLERMRDNGAHSCVIALEFLYLLLSAAKAKEKADIEREKLVARAKENADIEREKLVAKAKENADIERAKLCAYQYIQKRIIVHNHNYVRPDMAYKELLSPSSIMPSSLSKMHIVYDVLMENFPKTLVDNPEELKQSLGDLLGLKPTPRSFPGSMPVGLSRRHLHEIKNLENYYISEKTDGVRYLLYITDNKTLLIDRCYKFYEVSTFSETTPFSNTKGSGHLYRSLYVNGPTLIDGEIVLNLQTCSLCFLIFDCMAFDGYSCIKKNLPYRLENVRKFIGSYRDTFPFEVCLRYHPFFLAGKSLLQVHELRRLSSYINTSSKDTYYQEKRKPRECLPVDLHHFTDGIIFMPTEQRYILYSCLNLLKWKFPEKQSIDFMIKLPIEKSLTLYIRHENGHTPFKNDVALYPGDLDKLRQDTSYTKVNSKNSNRGEAIAEMTFDRQRGVWRYKTIRHDKANANYLSVAVDTLEATAENVTMADLLSMLDTMPIRRPNLNSNSNKPKQRNIV